MHSYPYPNIQNSRGDRLHPGTTWRGGGRYLPSRELQAGVLWRVATPIGYPSVLYLFSLTKPDCFVPLTAKLALALTPIDISDRFGPYRNRDWYQKFDAMGADIWAVENPTDYYDIVFLYSKRLSPTSNSIHCTVSRLMAMPGYENIVFQQLYDTFCKGLKEHQDKELAWKFENAIDYSAFDKNSVFHSNPGM